MAYHFKRIWRGMRFALYDLWFKWKAHSDSLSSPHRSLNHNYKGFISLLLLAGDAKYCFLMFDLGQYGSNNDMEYCLIVKWVKSFRKIEYISWYNPWWMLLRSSAVFLIGCEIFPLTTYLIRPIRPYPGEMLTEEKSV